MLELKDYILLVSLTVIAFWLSLAFIVFVLRPLFFLTKDSVSFLYTHIMLKLSTNYIFKLINIIGNPFTTEFPSFETVIAATICRLQNGKKNLFSGIAYLIASDDLHSKNKIPHFTNEIVRLLDSAFYKGFRLEHFFDLTLGYCPQKLLVQFNLHKKYFALQAIAEYSFFPQGIRDYCTEQCYQYRSNRNNSVDNIFHKKDIAQNVQPNNGGNK